MIRCSSGLIVGANQNWCRVGLSVTAGGFGDFGKAATGEQEFEMEL